MFKSSIFTSSNIASDENLLLPTHNEKGAIPSDKETKFFHKSQKIKGASRTRDKKSVVLASDQKDAERRSDEIDFYLAAEWQKRREDPRVLVMGMSDDVVMFWMGLQLLAKPITEEEVPDLQAAVQKRILAAVEDAIEPALRAAEQKELKAETDAGNDSYEMNLIHQALDPDATDADRAQCILALHGLGALDLAICDVDGEDDRSGISDIRWKQTDSTFVQLDNAFSPNFRPTRRNWLEMYTLYSLRGHVQEVAVQGHRKRITFFNFRYGGERRKWTHLLDDVQHCLVTVDSTISSDGLFDESGCPSMFAQIVDLVGSISNSQLFCNSHIIIAFYNKSALRKRLEASPFSSSQPGCHTRDAEEVIAHFFRLITKKSPSDRAIDYIELDDVEDESIRQVACFIEKGYDIGRA